MTTPILTPTYPGAPMRTRAPLPNWTLCVNCGAEYYPEDIPERLLYVGQYHTCADCRDVAASEVAE